MPHVFRPTLIAILLLGGSAMPGRAAAPATAPRVIPLWPEGSSNNPAEGPAPYLELFLPLNPKATAPGVIVIVPGGGYGTISPYERLQAEYFRAMGHTAVTVAYRVAPHHHPASYADAARAIRLVRHHTAEWSLPPGPLTVLGGSAGGHLAALVATRPDLHLDPEDELAGKVSARPDRLILLYPVITLVGDHAAENSRRRFLPPGATPVLAAQLSPQNHVTPDTPPVLLFHAADDELVPVENSLMFAAACRAAGVAAELHVFAHGSHGRNFAYDARLSPRWRRLALEWLAATAP